MASILDKINEITKQVKLQRSTDETLTPNAFLFICGLLEKQKYRPLDIGRQLGLLMVTLIEAPSCAATPEFFDLGQQIVSKISNYKNNSNTSINQNIIISMQRLRVLLPKSQVNDITLRIESISDLVNMWCFWSNCLSINFETSPSASIFRAIYQQTISPLLTTLLSHFVRYFDAPSLIVIADFTSMLCAHVVPSMSQSDKSMVVWHMIQIIRMIWEEFSTSLSKNVRVDFGSASILTSLINRIGPLVVKYSPTLDAILVDLLTEIVTSEPLLHVLSSDTAESRQVRNLANLSLYSIRALTKLQPLLEPSVLKFPLLQSTGVGILSWHMEAAVVHHRVSTLLELLSGSLKESSELIEWLLSQISGRFSEVSAVTDAPCDSTATNTRKDKRKASAEQSEQQSSDPFFDDAPFPEQPKQARTVSRTGVKGGYSLTDSLLVKSSSTSTNRQSNSSTSINQKVPSSTVVSVNQVAETVALVTSQCASNQSIVQQAHLCAWTLVEAAVDPNSLQMLYASQPQHAFNACLLVITAYECVIVALMAYVVNPLTTDILINVQLEAIIHHLTPAYVTSIKFMSQSHNSNSTSIALLSICRVYEVFSSHLRAEKNIEASVKQIRLQLVLIVHESLKDLVPEFKDVLTVKPTRSQVVVKESSCLPASPLFAPLDMLLDSGEISAIGVVLVSNLCLFDISKDQSTISEHDHFLNTLDLSVKKSVIISCVDTVQLLHDTGAVVLNVHQFMSMIQVCIKLSASSNDDCIYIQLLGKLCYMLCKSNFTH